MRNWCCDYIVDCLIARTLLFFVLHEMLNDRYGPMELVFAAYAEVGALILSNNNVE